MKISNLLRVVFFQAVWIVFASWQYDFELLAPILALIFVIIDYLIFYKEFSLSKLFKFMIFLVLSGIFIDSFLMNFGFISFKNHSSFLSPFYLWSIWIIFAPYYQFAFNKFKNKNYLSISLAMVGAPLAYYGGAKFGNLIVNEYAFFGIAVCWSIFFPISIALYNKLAN